MLATLQIFLLVAFSLIVLVAVLYLIDKNQRHRFVENARIEMEAHSLNMNNKAPVIVEQKIIIEAPIAEVWGVLSSVKDWSSWQSNITRVHIDSIPDKFVSFLWIAGGIGYESQIHMFEKEERFGWIGTTWGTQAIHNWYFEPIDANTTEVIVEESLEGLFPKLLTSFFIDLLTKGVNSNLNDLKIACESN